MSTLVKRKRESDNLLLRKRYGRIQLISGCVLTVCIVAVAVTVMIRRNADEEFKRI